MTILPSLIALELDLKGQALTQQVPYIQEGTGSFGNFLSTILTAIMAIAAISVFIFLIWGAFDYINSGGEKGKIDSARNRMTGAVMGLVVLATVLVIFTFIQQILGIELINFTPQSTSKLDPIVQPPSTGGRL